MHVEMLKRFLSEEWKAPASRFPWFGIGIVLIISAPIWPFFELLQSLPAHDDLVMRNGVINSLESTNPKSGCGTRVQLNTNTGQVSFCVQFCRPFPGGLSVGQSISAWLDPDQSEAWQVHQGNRVVCSYQNSAYEVASANRRLPLITAIQTVVGLLFTTIAFVFSRSRCNTVAASLTSALTRTRRKRRAG
jgi:hypothetical protein